MKKIVSIVGARPQFIKAAAVSREIMRRANEVEEVMVHTGQHYDPNMSQVFFEELEIPVPKYNLEISGGTHGVMTGRMLEGVERILIKEKPDWVLIYGDTNSTLAGAIAAAKLHIPVAHVEAGLRSFNMFMPEEINRILADRVSTLLLCPTDTAVENLCKEGVVTGVHNVGDVMYDVALYYRERARNSSNIQRKYGLENKEFALVTCHRAENTDDPARLECIFKALDSIASHYSVVLPLHPRTRKYLEKFGLEEYLSKLIVTEPLSFLDMISLEQSAKFILTDSGGVQKEAFFYQVPCITIRDETEWTETVSLGWNKLVGANYNEIMAAVKSATEQTGLKGEKPYGLGDSSKKVVDAILQYI